MFSRILPLGIIVAAIMLVLMWTVVTSDAFSLNAVAIPVPKDADFSNTKALGSVLYTDYVFAFEIAAVILLVAIVAAISLTMRKRPQTKYQNATEQIKVNAADRLRIVKMPSSGEES